MSKAYKGISAKIAHSEAGEFFSGRQSFLAMESLSQPSILVSPLAALDGSASAPSFDIVVASDESLALGVDGKPAPFGLPCITDEKLLRLMALDSVDGAGVQFQFLRDPSLIQDEAIVSIAVGGSATGAIDFLGDTDDITVTLVAGVRYMISLRGTGATALGDSYLEVFNPSAVIVNHDDDGGIGTNSLMTITAATSGIYTIRASAFANPGDPGTGQYTVDVRQMGADTVNSTVPSNVTIGQGITFGFRETATAAGGADSDIYNVSLVAGHYYVFNVAGGVDHETNVNAVPVGEIDTIIALRGPNGVSTILSQNDDISSSDISSSIGFYANTTGTYYLQVTGYAQGAVTGRNTGGYVIDFHEVPINQVNILDSINWDSAANMPTVDVGGVPTVYVYFAVAGQNFGENARAGDPTQPGGGGNGTLVSYGWDPYEQAQFMAAMQEYTKILGINYVVTTNAAQAGLRVITNSSLAYGAYAYPQDPAYGTQKGIAVFNVDNRGWNLDSADPAVTTDGLGRGGYAWSTILHEMGHAHGLSHPHDTGGGSEVMAGVTAAQGSLGLFNLNQGVYTQMSYNGGWQTHPDGALTGATNSDPAGFRSDAGWGATLGAFDIAELQLRYGVHPDFATGDNVYNLFDINAEGTFWECIYDTGGTDTIAYTGIRAAQIDLNTATLDYTVTGGGIVSFVHNLAGETAAMAIKGGYTIANGVVIENATGGSGNDVLIGNAVGNVLTGNNGNDTFMGRGGNDILAGGGGTDTAYYDGVRSNYTITLNIDGSGHLSYTVTDNFPASAALVNDEGTDTLTGINILHFADMNVDLSGPVVTSGPGDAAGSATEAISLDGIPGADQTANFRLEPVINYDAAIVSLLAAHPTDMHAVLTGLQALLPSGSGFAEAMAIVWDYVDDNFSYYNTVINEVSARLTVEYALYLQGGGAPLTGTAAKYTPDGGDAGTAPDRYQSLHDNILGNVNGAGLIDKFLDSSGGGSNGPPNGTADQAAYDRIIALLQRERPGRSRQPAGL